MASSEKLLVRGSGDRAPYLHRGVAQLAERWSPKPEVASSIPAAPAILRQGRVSPWVVLQARVDLLEVLSVLSFE